MTTLTAASPSMSGGMVLGTARTRPAGMAPLAVVFTIGDFLRIVRRRMVLIFTLWILSIGATIGFTFYMVKHNPKFPATAYVRIESLRPVNILNPLAQDQVGKQEVDRAVKNQALTAKSPEVLREVLTRSEVKGTTWYQEALARAKEKNEDTIDLLSDILIASPVRDSSYMAMSATTSVPGDVAEIVNAWMAEYLRHVEETERNSIRDSQTLLIKEVENSEKEMNQAQKDIDDFRSASQFIGIGNEVNEELMTVQALATELELDMLGKQSQYDVLASAEPGNMPITADMQILLAQDGVIQQLEQTQQNIQQQLEYLENRFGPNHRAVKDARVTLGLAAQRAGEERAAKILQYQKEQIEQARRSFLEASDAYIKVKEKLIQSQTDQRDLDRKRFEFQRKLERRDLARFKYEQLLQQKEYVQLTMRQNKVVQIQAVSSAVTPKRRESPRFEAWIPVGALIGLLASVGLALLIELADKSVRTPRDIARHAAVPVLGTIPTADDDQIEIERVETASLDAPHSIVAEAFRQLRANLFFSAPAEQQGVLLVTSPSGGNGKTVVATNLAIAIALSGRRVLLIDANFRRPALPKLFPQAKAEGLSNILVGQSRLAELASPTNVPGLDVLSAGPTPPNPAELLGSSYLRDVVVDARSRYDQVIFDGPPVLVVSDAVVLAGAVDGALLVCQYRKTSRGALQRARMQLESINARIFGAVLNQVETTAGGYYRQHYREFHAYQEDEEKGAPPPPQLEAAATAATMAAAATVDTHAAETPPVETDWRSEGAAAPESLGDIRLDESLNLGGDIDEADAGPHAPPGGSTRSDEADLLDLENEIDFGHGVDLGGDDLGLGDDFKLEDEPPPDDEPRQP